MVKSDYVLVSRMGPGVKENACKSHVEDLPFSYFDGNTNFAKKAEGITVIFTCSQCGQMLIFHRKTEKTLL